MRRHLLRVSIGFILALLLTACISIPAFAADMRSGDTVIVSAGEVINDDLFIAGNNIVIDGTINGDIIAAGSTITINGAVNGSIIAAGQTVSINGKIERGARIAGNMIRIGGTIGRDLIALGSDITIGENGAVGGDVLFLGRSLLAGGAVQGNIRGSSGSVTINNNVSGSVDITTGQLSLGSKAAVKGALIYTSENEASMQPGSSVTGKTARSIPEDKKATGGIFAGIAAALFGKFLAFLMILLAGIVFILAAPKQLIAVTDALRLDPWRSLGWGAVLLFATPVACIIAMITVIGLPLGLIALALWGIGIYLSQIPAALVVGKLIIKRGESQEPRGLMIGYLALGLFILLLLNWIPVLGFFIGLATALFGMGSLITAFTRAQH